MNAYNFKHGVEYRRSATKDQRYDGDNDVDEQSDVINEN